MSNFGEYIKGYESEVINTFAELVGAEYPMGKDVAEVDLIDIEIFCDKYCVGFGKDVIANLIIEEFEKRKNYFDVIINEGARNFAINALRDNFFNCGVCWCHGYDFESNAETWFTDKYSVVTIYDSNEEENKEPLVFVFDFNEITIDFEHFIECGIDYHTMLDAVDKATMKIK